MMYALLMLLQAVSYPPPVLPVSADVRSADLTLNSAGDATWDLSAAPFAGMPDVTHLPQAVNSTDLLICNFTTRTTTTITVHCVRLNTVSALLVGLFGGTLTGVKVNLIARYKAP